MPHRPYNILFLCTGNSARSIMAEALANHLPVGQGKFKAYSAGSKPGGKVNPLALETLAHFAVPSGTPRSKSWDEFAAVDAPVLDFVITVCDNAAGETCPWWPGVPVTAHWGVPDPPAAGDEAAQRSAFRDAFLTLRRRVEKLASLPFDQLDHAALEARARALGSQP